MILYIAVSPVALSSALVHDGEGGQTPVYFASEALQGAKLRYSEIEKLSYALVMALCKLRYYFQAHKITMPSQYPIEEVLRNKEAICHLGKWATELAPFDLHYVAQAAINSQVLADFVAEWTLPTSQVTLPANEDCHMPEPA
ncbi:hypothetical protein E2562_022418 [Oryza meyeriana var. granulata]|uniref:Reverse transcriptase RNase H-like domain-containing protein n=1 Tax=Oryza meyeriana var. granulata TaxID=110450 RepID=A0A6G1BN26_9ORYZ|nr:hypothetical protein E2562_022418 [Oryza meyeriana var. granulata]